MTDLVVQLREAARMAGLQTQVGDLLHHAAEDIERLRLQLRDALAGPSGMQFRADALLLPISDEPDEDETAAICPGCGEEPMDCRGGNDCPDHGTVGTQTMKPPIGDGLGMLRALIKDRRSRR